MYISRQVKVIQGKWVDVCGASQWMREERTVIQDEQGVQARGKEINGAETRYMLIERERRPSNGPRQLEQIGHLTHVLTGSGLGINKGELSVL